MVSRRTERTFSDLACGSGGHHIRTLCPRSAVCGQDGGIPEPHPCLHAHEFQILPANRLSSRHDGRLGRSGRPDASACAPVSLSAIRRACRQCMEVASCTKGCAGCHNHTNRAEAYGVSVCCWCERVSPGRRPTAIQGFMVPARPAGSGSRMRRFQAGEGWLDVPRMGARSGPAVPFRLKIRVRGG